jgi:hypothetical protein
MGLMNFLGKAASGLSAMGREAQVCTSVAEKFSDDELMDCLSGATNISLKFRGTPASDMSSFIKKAACKKVATDRGLI